jgi:arylsulfatase A-like enzyme
MNVVLLLSDALRAGNLGCYGYYKDTSPEIDRIAQKGIRFSNAFSTINATDSSLTTLFSGKYPLSHGVMNQGLQVTEREKGYTARLTLLPELLRKSGYVTIGIDWLGRWHRKGYDFYGRVRQSAEGFGAEDNSSDYTRRGGFGPGRLLSKAGVAVFSELMSLTRDNFYYGLSDKARANVRTWLLRNCERASVSAALTNKMPVFSDADAVTDLSIEHIKQFAKKQNFFLFAHYWDTHIPYTAPRSVVKELMKKYKYSDDKVAPIMKRLRGTRAERLIQKSIHGKKRPKTTGEIEAQYDASIRFVDKNIGRLYAALEGLGILKDTLVIIMADHGESMTEHEIYFAHHGLYEPQVKIPLILTGGNCPRGAVHDGFVQNFDIMPTILDFLRIEASQAGFDGQSLFKLIKLNERRFAYAEQAAPPRMRMVRDKKYKYIMRLDDAKCSCCQIHHSQTDELFDLMKDPDELHNIWDEQAAAPYKKELEDFVNSLSKPSDYQAPSFEDERDVLERLKALGYQ